MPVVERPRGLDRLVVLVGPGERDGKCVGVRIAAAPARPSFGDGAARRFRVVDLGACAHELVVQRRRHAPVGEAVGLTLGVGDSGLGQGVGEQEFGRPVDETESGLHALEHPPHAAGVEPGAFQRVESDAVRLLLPGPAEPQGVVLGERLGAEQRRHARFPAPGGGDGKRGEQTGQHPRGHGALLLDVPRVVALPQVRKLVGDDRGVFALVPGVEKEPQVDAHDTPGDGEGVDLRAVHQNRGESRFGDSGELRQPVNVDIDIVLEDRVGDRGDARPDLLERDLGELPFRHRRHQPGGPVPEFRQFRRLGRGCGQGQEQDGQAAQRHWGTCGLAEPWERDHTPYDLAGVHWCPAGVP